METVPFEILDVLLTPEYRRIWLRRQEEMLFLFYRGFNEVYLRKRLQLSNKLPLAGFEFLPVHIVLKHITKKSKKVMCGVFTKNFKIGLC